MIIPFKKLQSLPSSQSVLYHAVCSLVCLYSLLGPIHLQASSEAEADSELAWFYRPIYRPGITGQLRGRYFVDSFSI